jgi:hypothetical protein
MAEVSIREMWMLLGEKDVQIFQLLKEKQELLDVCMKLKEELNGKLEQPRPDDGILHAAVGTQGEG